MNHEAFLTDTLNSLESLRYRPTLITNKDEDETIFGTPGLRMLISSDIITIPFMLKNIIPVFNYGGVTYLEKLSELPDPYLVDPLLEEQYNSSKDPLVIGDYKIKEDHKVIFNFIRVPSFLLRDYSETLDSKIIKNYKLLDDKKIQEVISLILQKDKKETRHVYIFKHTTKASTYLIVHTLDHTHSGLIERVLLGLLPLLQTSATRVLTEPLKNLCKTILSAIIKSNSHYPEQIQTEIYNYIMAHHKELIDQLNLHIKLSRAVETLERRYIKEIESIDRSLESLAREYDREQVNKQRITKLLNLYLNDKNYISDSLKHMLVAPGVVDSSLYVSSNVVNINITLRTVLDGYVQDEMELFISNAQVVQELKEEAPDLYKLIYELYHESRGGFMVVGAYRYILDDAPKVELNNRMLYRDYSESISDHKAIMNNHHVKHNCLGNYRLVLSEAAASYDGHVIHASLLSSLKNINVSDIIVANGFFKDLLTTYLKGDLGEAEVELDGEVMTVKEAIALIKKEEENNG